MKLFLGLALALGSLARAAEPPHEWNGVSRVVAIGDVHGAYESFVSVLKTSGLIDEKLRWNGGTAHLVQTGDVVDRGPDSRKAMDLLMKLEKEAQRAGGRVHALIGNHEAMNIVGILDDVSPEELASYAEGLRGESPYPPGFVEHRLAFSPRGKYGRWILSHSVAVVIDGVVFSHGDWSEEMSALGIAEINRRVREELSGKAPLEGGVTFDPESPLQYRALSKTPLHADRPEVDRILANLGASFMVVGHTVTRGVIEPRFGGRHISIDVGMLELYGGGHRVALEIRDGKLRAVHAGGVVEIPARLDEAYLARVAEVDPDYRDSLPAPAASSR
jgi:hypothetical protein